MVSGLKGELVGRYLGDLQPQEAWIGGKAGDHSIRKLVSRPEIQLPEMPLCIGLNAAGAGAAEVLTLGGNQRGSRGQRYIRNRVRDLHPEKGGMEPGAS